MTTNPLPHHLDRTLVIRAPRDIVFSFFTDSERWASWWGAGSTIDPVEGGKVYIRYPNGIEAGGEVLKIDAPERIVFSYGFASGTPIPMGASQVTIACDSEGDATRVRLQHAFAEQSIGEDFVQGWRFQLSLFANIVTRLVHGRAAEKVDTWFAAWAEPDAAAREAMLASVAVPAVQFRDQYSCLDGMDEVLPHVAAAQRFMPGLRLQRDGDVRHCQGTVLANWTATGADGQPRGKGTNVFSMAPDGRIEAVTGLWGA
jgi:uncharacterized protein YndB with AHSA1/START domain